MRNAKVHKTKTGAVKRNCRDHNQDDQGYAAVQQVAPSADLISAAEKSQNQNEVAAAAVRGYLPLRRVTESGPQK